MAGVQVCVVLGDWCLSGLLSEWLWIVCDYLFALWMIRFPGVYSAFDIIEQIVGSVLL